MNPKIKAQMLKEYEDYIQKLYRLKLKKLQTLSEIRKQVDRKRIQQRNQVIQQLISKGGSDERPA